MARKKADPIIIHVEILCLPIRAIDDDIYAWRKRCEGLPEEQFEKCTQSLVVKRDALKEMYRIECGMDYE